MRPFALNQAPATSTPDQNWDRHFGGLLLGVVLFRLVYVCFFVRQFDLAGDEAYYWDWGRRLDWGYFSKPPMIGPMRPTMI